MSTLRISSMMFCQQVNPNDHKLNVYHQWLWRNHVELGID